MKDYNKHVEGTWTGQLNINYKIRLSRKWNITAFLIKPELWAADLVRCQFDSWIPIWLSYSKTYTAFVVAQYSSLLDQETRCPKTRAYDMRRMYKTGVASFYLSESCRPGDYTWWAITFHVPLSPSPRNPTACPMRLIVSWAVSV